MRIYKKNSIQAKITPILFQKVQRNTLDITSDSRDESFDAVGLTLDDSEVSKIVTLKIKPNALGSFAVDVLD